MPLCLIGLGSNLGDRAELLAEALVRLHRSGGAEVLRQSRFLETNPAGGPANQPRYLNAAAVLRTSLNPAELLAELQRIESSLDRRRAERWGPRTIDIDLLLYDDRIVSAPGLEIPHPRMAWRRFVLAPAAEVAPNMIHPAVGWTVARLLEHLDRTPWYLAIAGGPDLVRAQLASEVARKCQARLLAEPVFAPRWTDRADVPAVHACEIELEFLQRRVRPLAADQPEWQSTDRPTISDYWFDQSAATATACFPSEWREQYLEQCAEWQARIVQPRLLVLLRNSGQEVCSDAQARSDAALRSQAAVAGGPQLVLDTSEHAANVEELSAAVDAMQ